MLDSSGRDQPVRHGNLTSFTALLTGDDSPTLRDGLGPRQKTIGKPWPHYPIQPVLQLGPALALAQSGNPFRDSPMVITLA